METGLSEFASSNKLWYREPPEAPQRPLRGLWESPESTRSHHRLNEKIHSAVEDDKYSQRVNGHLLKCSTNETKPAPTFNQLQANLVSFFFWPYRFRVLAPPSVTPYRTNQSQGRLRRGLGARIGGMDKNHNADRRTEKWDRKSWTRVMKVTLLVCPT